MKTISLLISLLLSGMVSAVPIHQIQIGEGYYINNLLRDNDLVLVRDVDRSHHRVKVQYPSGVVDWVNPDKLHTRSEARKLDTQEAVIGVAGTVAAIWAILDPEGFKQSLNNAPAKAAEQSPNRSSPSALNANIRPVVDGEWVLQEDGVQSAFLNRISRTGWGDIAANIETIHAKKLQFHGEDRFIVRGITKKERRAFYWLSNNDFSVLHGLSGNGNPIHEFNQKLNYTVRDSTTAYKYLKFFTSAIVGDGKNPFLIVENPAQIAKLIDGDDYLKEPQVSRDGTGFIIRTNVLFQSILFETAFKVFENGMVEMIWDRPLVELAKG